MIAYHPVVYRPAYSPMYRPSLGQQASPTVTPGQVKAAAGVVGLGMLALSSATAWVGIRTGLKEGGSLFGIAAWVVGIAGAVSGLFELIGMTSVLAQPSAAIQQQIDEAKRRAAATTTSPM